MPEAGRQIGVPPWVVWHVPHDSTLVPAEVRDQFILTDDELQAELRRMTDHLTNALFTTAASGVIVRAPVSRLVVDVERFPDDAQEPMAARGMGAIYGVTSMLRPLRRALSPGERASLMERWYHAHHQQLEDDVGRAVDRHGRCLIIDCHSFPSVPLPYELDAGSSPRADICIGTDVFHTSEGLASRFMVAFAGQGWTVARDTPFAGTMVPASRYRRDRRVESIMVEVNRGLYLNEAEGIPKGEFDDVSARIRKCCLSGILEGTA